MGCFEIVASAVRARLVALADWLHGCSHRKTTFPITLRAGASVNGQPGTQMETYVVCLECGRRFAYDWTMMRITTPRWLTPEVAPHCNGDVRSAMEMSHD